MTKSSMSWWDRFLFRDKGILPSKRFLQFYICFSLLLMCSSFFNVSWGLIFCLNVAFIAFSLIDLFYSPRKSELIFERIMPDELERGLTTLVHINVINRSNQACRLTLQDGVNESFKHSFPIYMQMRSQEHKEIQYKTIPRVRGDFTISPLYVRYTSILGLWTKQLAVPLEDHVKVIPDLTDTKQYLYDDQKFLLFEGNKIRKYSSGVGEFSQIRNYVFGDDPRKINWRQTAKLQQVMANEYEPEHGKYVTIMLDCGRMMGAELATSNRLEKTLEAALTVAAAALQRGDYVSVIGFSHHIHVYIPPAKGMEHLQTIIKSVYNLKVDNKESDYSTVFSFLELKQKKRSLLLLFSDIRTFLYEENALVYLKKLRQRHLFLMIGIEDKQLIDKMNEYPSDERIAMEKSIAMQLMNDKRREQARWEKQGLQMVEAPEEAVTVTAVSNYIYIMTRNLL